MYQKITKTVTDANLCNAMRTGEHSRNGVSLKSHLSRSIKFLVIFCLLQFIVISAFGQFGYRYDDKTVTINGRTIVKPSSGSSSNSNNRGNSGSQLGSTIGSALGKAAANALLDWLFTPQNEAPASVYYFNNNYYSSLAERDAAVLEYNEELKRKFEADKQGLIEELKGMAQDPLGLQIQGYDPAGTLDFKGMGEWGEESRLMVFADDAAITSELGFGWGRALDGNIVQLIPKASSFLDINADHVNEFMDMYLEYTDAAFSEAIAMAPIDPIRKFAVSTAMSVSIKVGKEVSQGKPLDTKFWLKTTKDTGKGAVSSFVEYYTGSLGGIGAKTMLNIGDDASDKDAKTILINTARNVGDDIHPVLGRSTEAILKRKTR